MSKAWAAVSVFVSVASLGVAFWALDEAHRARSTPATPSTAPGRAATLEARIEAIEKRFGESAPETSAAPAGMAAADPARAALDGPPPEEGLRALVRQTVKEEIETREKEAGEAKASPPSDGRKPPLSQVAAELELDDSQRTAVHQAVLRGQEETIALLRTPTPDGRVPLDDLLRVLLAKPEAAKENIVEVFGMLATEKVPGSEETYAQRLEGVKKSTTEAFRRTFTPEQFKAYEKTGQDPLEIQVPDSPWIQVLQDAWKKSR